jgi:hypothetical protein
MLDDLLVKILFSNQHSFIFYHFSDLQNHEPRSINYRHNSVNYIQIHFSYLPFYYRDPAALDAFLRSSAKSVY